MAEKKRLYRSKDNKVIAGVCGGLGEYFEVDPVLFRVVFVVLALTMGSGVLLYLILMIIIPEEKGKEINKKGIEKTFKESAENMAKIGKNLGGDKDEKGMRNVIGIGLVVFGAWMIMERFVPIMGRVSMGPVVLILVGLIILAKKK